MMITMNHIKYSIAVAMFVMIMLSSVVHAAGDEMYLVATPAVSKVQAQAPTATILQDTFLAAFQTPTNLRTISYVPRVTARTMYVTSTGYTSEVAQTDDSPFITANGEHVYWTGVAANFLPFGTKLKIPEYFGDQVFTVNDRMNKRYWERVDVWFAAKPDALKWGNRTIKIEILG